MSHYGSDAARYAMESSMNKYGHERREAAIRTSRNLELKTEILSLRMDRKSQNFNEPGAIIFICLYSSKTRLRWYVLTDEM